MTEIGVYTVLAAAVAGAVFIAGGRPMWHVVVVGVSAALIIVVLAVISRRAGRPVPTETTAQSEPSDKSSDRPAAKPGAAPDLPARRIPNTTDAGSPTREQYARHNPYTRPSTNTRPIPDVQPAAPSGSNPYVDGNPYAQDTTDAPPNDADTTAGDGVRRGRRRRR